MFKCYGVKYDDYKERQVKLEVFIFIKFAAYIMVKKCTCECRATCTCKIIIMIHNVSAVVLKCKMLKEINYIGRDKILKESCLDLMDVLLYLFYIIALHLHLEWHNY